MDALTASKSWELWLDDGSSRVERGRLTRAKAVGALTRARLHDRSRFRSQVGFQETEVDARRLDFGDVLAQGHGERRVLGGRKAELFLLTEVH